MGPQEFKFVLLSLYFQLTTTPAILVAKEFIFTMGNFESLCWAQYLATD